MIREIERKVTSGGVMLVLLIVATGIVVLGFIGGVRSENPGQAVLMALAFILVMVLWGGLFTVQPGQARVMQLFGGYVGSVREPGLRWANPFYTKKAISLRVRNFETTKLKVNDHNSNPIEIGAVVVWQVTDTAEALFVCGSQRRAGASRENLSLG